MYSILSRLDDIDAKLQSHAAYRGRTEGRTGGKTDKRIKFVYQIANEAPQEREIMEDNNEETSENFSRHLLFILYNNGVNKFTKTHLETLVKRDEHIYRDSINGFPTTFYDKLIAHIDMFLQSKYVVRGRMA